MSSSHSSTSQTVPPRWDLSSIYPGLDAGAYQNAKEELAEFITEAEALMNNAGLRSENPEKWLSDAIEALNRVRGRYENLYAFGYAHFSTATTDALPMKEIGKLEEAGLPLRRVETGFRNALKEIENQLPQILQSSPQLQEYRLFIEEELLNQVHQMSPEMEDLAADLSRSGGDAWSRLQENIASTLSAVWDETTGERKTVTQLRSMAFSPDRHVREKAYRLELAAWKTMEGPASFALNGVKGFSHTLNSRRNYAGTLERSVWQSRISRAALDALIGAMEESLPVFRTYLRTKADLLGIDRLAFYDLFAPISKGRKNAWSFEEARNFVLRHFSSFSEELADFTREAFDRNWIDAEPRSGKVGGAYCISFPEQKQSRVLSNFSGALRDISTLAHELGHAYHHHVVRDLSAIHQDYPMTLAETASIFAETLVTDKALEELEGEERLALLESSLQDSTQVIVDILSRFYFESELMELRRDHELNPGELCELMVQAQKKAYGDGLDETLLHPYMWAVKGHYYRQDLAFYNFPYAFGLLFGLALYGEYKKSPRDFTELYRGVLADTGRLNAVELTRKAGFNIESTDFWRSGLKVIGGQVDDFTAAAAAIG